MEHDELMDLIQQQILDSQAHFEAQLRRGERTRDTVDLLRSLRLTLRLLLSGKDPEDEAATSFALSVSEEGRVLLRRDRNVVRAPAAFLQFLRHTGFCLVRGEVLLLEPELARRVIEDSLGELAREEWRLQRDREALTAALLSSQELRKPLLQALGQLDERTADLPVQRVALFELNLAASAADSATFQEREARPRRCG